MDERRDEKIASGYARVVPDNQSHNTVYANLVNDRYARTWYNMVKAPWVEIIDLLRIFRQWRILDFVYISR